MTSRMLGAGTQLVLVVVMITSWQPLAAQRGATVGLTGGVVTIFDGSGFYASLGILPIRIKSGDSFKITGGASGWIGQTSTRLGGSIKRKLIAGGPEIEINYTPSPEQLAFFSRIRVQRVRSDVSYITTGAGPQPAPEDRDRRRTGWAYGAELGIEHPLQEGIRVQAGIGYLRQAIFSGRSGGMWQFSAGIEIGR